MATISEGCDQYQKARVCQGRFLENFKIPVIRSQEWLAAYWKANREKKLAGVWEL